MTLPDLDDLIAEVDRTCATAHRPGGQDEQPDWLALLTVAARISGRLQALADDLVEDYVEHCRMHGSSWTDVGAALGVTRQAVQQRFQAPHKRYAPETMTEDLRQAMVHVKEAAVRHHNNYIGTEHLLWGLTARDNSATRLLRGVGRLARCRCTAPSATGSAWAPPGRPNGSRGLPYSRKALALAEARAERTGSQLIDCADLLIGLAQVGRGVAAAVLTESGADLGHGGLGSGAGSGSGSGAGLAVRAGNVLDRPDLLGQLRDRDRLRPDPRSMSRRWVGRHGKPRPRTARAVVRPLHGEFGLSREAGSGAGGIAAVEDHVVLGFVRRRRAPRSAASGSIRRVDPYRDDTGPPRLLLADVSARA